MEEELGREPHWLFGKWRVPPLKELLMTPMGIVAIISTFSFSFVLIYFSYFDPS